MANGAFAANPDGDLRIEPVTAYNFVVDSNITSPSTYAPSAAMLSANFCNDGANPLTDVTAYIGDFGTNLGDSTPGVYPERNAGDAGFDTEHTLLYNAAPTGSYSLTHEGGSTGTGDAARSIGTLDPGECRMVYWLVSYPQVDADHQPGDPSGTSVAGRCQAGR